MDEKVIFNEDDISELENFEKTEEELAEEVKEKTEENIVNSVEEKEVQDVEIKLSSIFEKIGKKNLIIEKIFMFFSFLLTLNILHTIFSIFKIRYLIYSLTTNLKSYENIFEGINDIDVTTISGFTNSFKSLVLSQNTLKILFLITFLILVYLIVEDGMKFKTRTILKGQFITGLLGSLILFFSISRFSTNIKYFNEVSNPVQNIPQLENFSDIARDLLFSNLNFQILKMSLVYLIVMSLWGLTVYIMYLKLFKNKQIRITL